MAPSGSTPGHSQAVALAGSTLAVASRKAGPFCRSSGGSPRASGFGDDWAWARAVRASGALVCEHCARRSRNSSAKSVEKPGRRQAERRRVRGYDGHRGLGPQLRDFTVQLGDPLGVAAGDRRRPCSAVSRVRSMDFSAATLRASSSPCERSETGCGPMAKLTAAKAQTRRGRTTTP